MDSSVKFVKGGHGYCLRASDDLEVTSGIAGLIHWAQKISSANGKFEVHYAPPGVAGSSAADFYVGYEHSDIMTVIFFERRS